jgi:hypothetical protein
MARDEAPPFARGETYFNGTTPDLTVFSYPINLAGKEYVFEVDSPDGYDQGDPSGRLVRCRIVQNLSGGAMLPGRLARHQITDPLECYTDGYFYATGDQLAGVVDELLPAAGVPANDFFWVVVEGPTKVQTVSSGFAAIAQGGRLEAQTGTGPLTADAGLVANYAGSPAVGDIFKMVGRAQDAASAAGLIKAVVHIPHY